MPGVCGLEREDQPSAATQRLKALQVLLSRHIVAHLGMHGLHRAQETQHSETRPVSTARTAGSGYL